VLIRPYQEADRPFLRTLYLASRKAAWHWIDPDSLALEDFDQATLNEHIIVAEENGHRLGFASIFTAENFLHNLFVAPDIQGQGVGSALLHAAEQTFTSTGSLKCLVNSEKSVKFYQRHDWKIIATGDSPQGEYYLLHFVLPLAR